MESRIHAGIMQAGRGVPGPVPPSAPVLASTLPCAPSPASSLAPMSVPSLVARSMLAPVRAIALVLALAFVCLGIAPSAAWAVEGENANRVDPQLLPDSSFIYDTSIVDLSQADSYFDGQTVRVTGEVVGDCRQELGDPDHCWITLTDPAYDVNNTVEIFMTDEQASRIESYGAYGRIGSIVSVQGTFHLVCAEHGGASDVHADTMSISSRGGEVSHPFNAMDFVPGLAACGVGLLMMLALWYLRERRR